MFDLLFDFVHQITQQNIASFVGIFAATITPLIGACVVLYAIYLAIQALYDAENMMIMESVKFIGSLALCTTVAFNTSWYLSSIVPMVYYSGDDISNALLGSTGSGSLQTMFETMLRQFNAVWNQANFGLTDSWSRSILFLFSACLILLGYMPFLLVATAYLLIAKVMVSFLLILGPLFIMFAFFPSTRSMFQTWTGQCFNYVLLTIVYPLAFSIFTQTINYIVFSGENKMTLSSIFVMFILFGCCILISVQIPVFCSSLSGGVGINGLVSNMGMGMRSLSNLAKGGAGATKQAGQSTYSAGKSLYDQTRNRIRPG
ncbi:type IV secretion system protein [Vibrio natriegens]|uniref:type IV secretion system protein n=1 Tax=Vibrio natriegens TaxID=691 RepID=UPI002283DF19|nr:type IV secretion system protein [Vibrio natriegens]MCY9876977.1 type IV secretion system protein [Vibrio natriegens]